MGNYLWKRNSWDIGIDCEKLIFKSNQIIIKNMPIYTKHSQLMSLSIIFVGIVTHFAPVMVDNSKSFAPFVKKVFTL